MKLKRLTLVIICFLVALLFIFGVPNVIYSDENVTVVKLRSFAGLVGHVSDVKLIKLKGGGLYRGVRGGSPYYLKSTDSKYIFFLVDGQTRAFYSWRIGGDVKEVDLKGYSVGDCIGAGEWTDVVISGGEGEVVFKKDRGEIVSYLHVDKNDWSLREIYVYKSNKLDSVEKF